MISIIYTAFLLLSVVPSLAQRDEDCNRCFVYVSLRDENAIQIYELTTDTGELKHIEKFAVEGGPASMCFNNSKNILYVAHRGSNRISAYKVDKASGKLSVINSISAIDNPVYISLDKNKQFLFSVYYAAGKFAVYEIGENGGLIDSVHQVIEGFVNPHSVIADATNRFVFIADKSGDKIYQYRFDEVKGLIKPNDPPEILTNKNTGPRHFVFNKNNSIAYFSDENSSSVSVFHLNKESGSLNLLQKVSALPENFTGANTCADIHITPDNKFVFASNRGHDSIALFTVEPKTGMLKFTGTVSTVKTPREFDIDPTGNILIAAGEDSDDLALYKIEHHNGKLLPLNSFHTGKRPSWVTIICAK